MIHFLLNWFKNHRWSTAFMVFFVGLIVLMPIALQTGLQQILLKQGQPHGINRVEVGDIDFNPFMATFSLNKLTLYRDQAVLAQINQLDLRLRLRDLLQKRLMVDSFTLRDAHIPLRLTEDNQIEIAGFPIPLAPESELEEENSQLAIQFGIKALHLSKTSITLESAGHNTTFTINNLTINEEADYARLILSSHLNNSPLNANLQLHQLMDSPKIIGTLNLDKLDLSELQHFFPEQPLNAILSNDITFTLQQEATGFAFYQQGDWSIDGLEFKQGQNNLALKKFDWKGDVHFFTENTPANPGNAPKATLRGQANLKGFKLIDNASKTTISQDAVADLNLTALLDPSKPTVSQTGKLVINQFKLDSPSINSQNSQTTWLGKVDFTGGKSPVIKTQGLLTMTDVLTSLPVQNLTLQHQLNAHLNLQANLGAASTSATTLQQTGDLDLNNLQVTQPPLQLNLANTHWNGELQVSQKVASEVEASTLSITSNGQMKASGLRALNQKKQLTLAEFETLSIHNLLVKQLADISLQGIQLTHLKVAQPKDPKQPGLVTLKNLKLDHAKLQNLNELTLGTLELEGSETHITLDKTGKIEQLVDLLADLPGTETIAMVEATPKVPKTKATFHYQLQGLKTSDSHRIHIKSHQVEPPFSKTIQLTALTLGQLNSQKPLEATPFNLALQLDEFSRLNSQGSVQPLNSSFNLTATSKLDGFSLLEFSPLIEQKLGYQIKRGQLSVDSTTNIKDNIIDAENRIHLNKFLLASADKSKTAQIEKDFSMPLEAGLALLKDKNDNIDLKLPIKGDLNTPDFQLQSVISRAINSSLVKASRTYLLLALQPFGAILLAGEFAADQLTAVKLQSVTFAPGDSTLSSQMLVYMNKIHKVLDERKSIQIKLCGGVNEQDRIALQQFSVKEPVKATQDKTSQSSVDSDNGNGITPVNKSSKMTITDAQLLKLASERQAEIKRHLIKIGSQSKQIILCQPKITASKQPSVDLGI